MAQQATVTYTIRVPAELAKRIDEARDPEQSRNEWALSAFEDKLAGQLAPAAATVRA